MIEIHDECVFDQEVMLDPCLPATQRVYSPQLSYLHCFFMQFSMLDLFDVHDIGDRFQDFAWSIVHNLSVSLTLSRHRHARIRGF
jgi:hypothetical protein